MIKVVAFTGESRVIKKAGEMKHQALKQGWSQRAAPGATPTKLTN